METEELMKAESERQRLKNIKRARRRSGIWRSLGKGRRHAQYCAFGEQYKFHAVGI